MQADRSADAARLAGSVRGLGVCDVLRVDLAGTQRAQLVAALDARIVVLDPPAGDVEAKEIREELRLLERIRAGVPEPGCEPFVLTGPAGLVSELVAACVSTAVHELAAEGAAARDSVLEVAGAWIATVLECRAVEAFCFDPGLDPAHAW